MNIPRSIAAFTATWLLLTAAVAVWCCALSGCSTPAPPAVDEPVTYPIKAACSMCNGDGTLADNETGKVHPCGECKGTGERPVYEWEKRIPCEACKEAGQIGGVECEECQGLGWIPKYEFKDGEFGRIGDRWRNRPKPIQKIVHDAKETTANGADIAKWLGLSCLGFGALVVLAAIIGLVTRVIPGRRA